jgi:AbrB family looped-hinge helix DNA binding protein
MGGALDRPTGLDAALAHRGKILTCRILTVRITSKGQVTIPQDIRERLGLLPHTEVEFSVERGRAILKPKSPASRAERIVRHLREHGGRMRMSSKQLLSLLRDEADEIDAR